MEEFKLLIPEFGALTLSVLLFLSVILYYRLHRKSMCIFYLLILTELYTPACYYMSGTTNYLTFGPEALRLYMFVGTLSFLSYSLILLCVQQLRFQKRRLTLSRLDIPAARPQTLLWLCIVGTIAVITAYLFYFREGLPLYQAIFTKTKIDRPDSTGGIPHWFTISALICITCPCFYLYYHQKYGFHKITNLAIISVVSLYMVLGGNKGLLVYWFLFLWVYIWKMRIDLRIVLAGLAAVVFTAIIMTGTTTTLSLAGLRSVAEYGFGRFFLTQGAMLVNRFELILQDYPFDPLNITKQVFTFVYKRDGGSSPTYYLGDLLIHFGLIGGFLLHLVVFAVLAIVGRYLDCQEFSEYKTYLFFMVQFFLGIAAISSSFIFRLLLIIALALLFGLLGERPAPSEARGISIRKGTLPTRPE